MKRIVALVWLILIASTFLHAQKKAITVDDLWDMKRVGNITLAPDSKTIAFTVTEYHMEDNSSTREIWLINPDGTDLRKLNTGEGKVGEPVFLPCGQKISYIKNGQLYVCRLNGSENTKVTDIYSGVSGVEFSPDGSRMLFVSFVYPDLTTQEENKARDEENEASLVKAKVFTELMYKTWNDWRGPKRGHLFLYDFKSKELTDLTLNATFDVPPIDLGSSNDYSFSPDGKEVAFCANLDKVVATSTNNDIHIINLADVEKGKAVPFKTISMSKGNDNQPVYSPDGEWIAFRSMERAGFEADKQRLALYNRKSGELAYSGLSFDISVGEMVWAPDSKSIYFNSANEVYNSIYNHNITDGVTTLIKKEVVSSNLNICHAGMALFFGNQKSTLPTEIFMLKTDGSELKQLTSTNKELLANIEWNPIETFWTDGAEGAKVQSLMVKPPFFDESKKYPLIFLIHGGPQGHWDDNFHYRWNAQMFASRGYVVIATNPRGSVGYGQKFTDEISKDWGGKAYVDLMNAYDYSVENFNFIDKSHTYAAGASYGGYMINWIEGHTDRFTALVCHAGVFNLESMYGVTEELWFPEWEMGGTPWENPELYAKWSPHKFISNFKTPMLVVHGAMDFRVPEGQAFELFTALQKMNVESKMLYYPDEYHFVVKPQNAKLWWNTIFDWYAKFNKR